MSTEHNRRDFISRFFRLGGLFAAFGSWNAWAAFNLSDRFIGKSAPVPARLLVTEANDLIDHFVKSRGAASVYYCQMFFPIFITGNEVAKVITLEQICQERLMTADPAVRARLRVVPAIAAAHMLPIADSDDTQALRDMFLKTHHAGLGEDEPCRSVLGFIWTCMTAAVVRNQLNWEKMLVGPDIVKAAQDVCLQFANGTDSTSPLIHASAAAWQFLLTYQKALLEREHTEAANELRSVHAAISRVKEAKGLNYIWLDEIDKMYKSVSGYQEIPPEYFELIIGRSRTTLNSPERRNSDFFVLLRLQLMYSSYLAEIGTIDSPYLSDPHVAEEMRKRMFAFLVNFGVSPIDWPVLKLQGERLLTRDCIKYLGSVFERYDEVAADAGAGGEDARYAAWYSKHIPFKNFLTEEAVAGMVYSHPQTMRTALNALDESQNVYARLAFCLPALTFGFNLESHDNPKVAAIRNGAILEQVCGASLDLLQNPQYTTAFDLLSKEGPSFRKELDKRGVNILARLNLAESGGNKLLRGKERMHETHKPIESNESENLIAEAAIRDHFHASARAAGISEQDAKEFLDVKEPLKDTRYSTVYEEDRPEVMGAIRDHFLASAQAAGISEQDAKEFFNVQLHVND